MDDKNKRLQALQEKYPALLGKFLGFKYRRGGMGVTRTDNDWFECDEYYITADDLAAFLEGLQADLAKAEQARSDMAATPTSAQAAGTAAVEARRRAEAETKKAESRAAMFEVFARAIFENKGMCPEGHAPGSASCGLGQACFASQDGGCLIEEWLEEQGA